MNDRIKQLRLACNLSQDAFAKKLGLKSRGKIANLEFGKTIPDKEFLELMCFTFNANIEWLEYGVGEMFVQKTRSETIAEFAGNLMKEEEESFKRRLVEALAQLEEDEWETLEKLAIKLTEKKD